MMNRVRLTVDLASDFSPEEIHQLAIDALIEVVNVTDDHGIVVLQAGTLP